MAQILIDALNAAPPPAEFTANAKRMYDLFALHEFQAVVEVFGNALEAEINRELDDSNPLIQEIAADFRELICIDEDVLDLRLGTDARAQPLCAICSANFTAPNRSPASCSG